MFCVPLCTLDYSQDYCRFLNRNRWSKKSRYVRVPLCALTTQSENYNRLYLRSINRIGNVLRAFMHTRLFPWCDLFRAPLCTLAVRLWNYCRLPKWNRGTKLELLRVPLCTLDNSLQLPVKPVFCRKRKRTLGTIVNSLSISHSKPTNVVKNCNRLKNNYCLCFGWLVTLPAQSCQTKLGAAD